MIIFFREYYDNKGPFFFFRKKEGPKIGSLDRLYPKDQKLSYRITKEIFRPLAFKWVTPED